jgi:hypothetical protein
MGWTIGVLGFDSRWGMGTTASRRALGPTQPLSQWIPRTLSLGVNRPEYEADNSPLSSAEVNEWVELYFFSPNTPSWCGVQLKKHRDNFTFTFTFYLYQNLKAPKCFKCCIKYMHVKKDYFFIFHRPNVLLVLTNYNSLTLMFKSPVIVYIFQEVFEKWIRRFTLVHS